MEHDEKLEKAGETSGKFFLLLIAGFVIVFAGIAVILITAIFSSGGSVSAGVIIFIGPFPIVIGAGPDVTWIVLFSILLAVLSVVMFLVLDKRMRKFSD